ncbi:hypothetical protein GCK72_018561 [Caenorhabditis remanei]|uniref:Uncharacterized protein n=1 Tax=Caenorhabditis remanei TaxID=31234 RepID=A0A6A5GA46_CAERE|nr:hypothetical protein GCK72_018561 [Caenorhabditis remanei]KAF1752007.1 hypothetical protein GCK72_018561 [Caenorhabditis remanei]
MAESTSTLMPTDDWGRRRRQRGNIIPMTSKTASSCSGYQGMSLFRWITPPTRDKTMKSDPFCWWRICILTGRCVHLEFKLDLQDLKVLSNLFIYV